LAVAAFFHAFLRVHRASVQVSGKYDAPNSDTAFLQGYSRSRQSLIADRDLLNHHSLCRWASSSGFGRCRNNRTRRW